MATKWQSVYEDVCNVLLELPSGLTLGLFTEAQFLTLAGEVLTDLAAKSGIIRKIFNVGIDFGVPSYQLPINMSELQGCIGAGNFLFETSDFFLSNYNDGWATWMNGPEAFKQDEIDPRMVLLEPIPNAQGDQVNVILGVGAYGVIASATNPVDFDVQVSYTTPQGYGTIAGGLGNPYLETVNPGYGILAAMIPSTGNLQMQGSAQPDNIANLTLQTYIELIPDSLVHYVKYGILAAIFGGDNELRDEQKQAYCQARYQECAALLSNMMDMEYQEG